MFVMLIFIVSFVDCFVCEFYISDSYDGVQRATVCVGAETFCVIIRASYLVKRKLIVYNSYI